jgi:threonine dehydrogenase-like Zn-dependent dehydrogenase
MAASVGAIPVDFMKEDVYDKIQDLTGGRGVDASIDAVGTEPHTSASFDSMSDRAKVAVFLGTDRPHVLRQAIHCTQNFGVVSVVGVYGGFVDKLPMGSAINRGLTFRMAQTPVQRYLPKLLKLIEDGRIGPSFVITHTVGLEQGPDMYKTFRDK